MKRKLIIAAVLLVMAALGMTMFVHAGSLPQVNWQEVTVPEVSSEYEVPISIEDPVANSLTLSEQTLTLTYRATKKLTASVRNVTWASSNEKVVRVDQNGTLTAAGRGTATVTATASDGSSAACKVTVRYTVWQWIIRILLFGWIWY